jgi:hypothetical protein
MEGLYKLTSPRRTWFLLLIFLLGGLLCAVTPSTFDPDKFSQHRRSCIYLRGKCNLRFLFRAPGMASLSTLAILAIASSSADAALNATSCKQGQYACVDAQSYCADHEVKKCAVGTTCSETYHEGHLDQIPCLPCAKIVPGDQSPSCYYSPCCSGQNTYCNSAKRCELNPTSITGIKVIHT